MTLIFKLIENQLLGLKKLDFEFYAKNVFAKSLFSNKEKMFAFLDAPSILLIERDPAYKIMKSNLEKLACFIKYKSYTATNNIPVVLRGKELL